MTLEEEYTVLARVLGWDQRLKDWHGVSDFPQIGRTVEDMVTEEQAAIRTALHAVREEYRRLPGCADGVVQVGGGLAYGRRCVHFGGTEECRDGLDARIDALGAKEESHANQD